MLRWVCEGGSPIRRLRRCWPILVLLLALLVVSTLLWRLRCAQVYPLLYSGSCCALSRVPRRFGLLLKPHALPLHVGVRFLPSLDLPRCLLGYPRVSAISSQCLLVVIVVPPFIVFIVVSHYSVRHPSFKSTVTLQGRTCFPAVLYTLVLGHIMP